MASAKAWGTITIVDTTDIGQFSVTPSSNRATTVIYTPDNNTYTPNWAETSGNVTITPIIYYGGTQLSPGNNPTVTWAYKTNDSTTFTTITSSSPSWAKPQSNGTLKLTGNPFTSSSVSSVTIKCTSNYNEPATNLPLTAAGEITYSVVRQAASVPYVRITGENVFKYNTSQTLVGAESITLTAAHAHCTISKWQYKKVANNVETWTDIANTTGVDALTINAKSTAHAVYFENNVATFRVVTSVSGLIDVHVITKIYDGAAGQSTLAAILTNEDQMLPADAAGHVDAQTGYVDAYTQLIIYRGGEDVTSEYTDITISASEGITFEKSSDGTNWQASTVTTGVFTHVHVTGIGDGYNVGSVTFSAKKTSGSTEAPLVKKFSLVKVSTGADGADAVTYMLEASSQVVHVNANDAVDSGSLIFNIYKRVGNSERTLTFGKLYITAPDGTVTYQNSGSIKTKEFTASSNVVKAIAAQGSSIVRLYDPSVTNYNTATPLDMMTITCVKDGEQGIQGVQGAPGTSPINVVLGNYSDSIACNKSNVILPTNTALVLDIPYTAYHGTNRVYCVVPNAPSITYNTTKNPITAGVTASDASTDGHVRFTFPKGAAIDDAHANGTVAITFVVKETETSIESLGTVLAYYTYSRVSTGATGAKGADGADGADGESAYVGIISTPNGNVFSNGAGSLLITAQLYLGSDDVSSASSFQWAEFSGSTYTDLSDETSSTLTVGGGDVNGLASYRCTISHNSAVRAVLYATLIDKTDPIQAEILSTAGDKFVNGIAEGAMYVKVYRNGVEIDPLPTEDISKTAPASPTANQMYFKIDTATNSVKLMKYVSGAWAEQTYTPTARYTWSYLDKDGEEVHPSGMATSGKIIYVDGDFVNVKLTAFCQVEV